MRQAATALLVVGLLGAAGWLLLRARRAATPLTSPPDAGDNAEAAPPAQLDAAPTPPGIDPRYWGSSTAARNGWDNTPPPEVWDALERVQASVEAVELLVGAVYVSSGYRAPRLNTAVGGVRGSLHLKGKAVDLAPREGTTREDLLQACDLVFSNVIPEQDGRSWWLHCEV